MDFRSRAGEIQERTIENQVLQVLYSKRIVENDIKHLDQINFMGEFRLPPVSFGYSPRQPLFLFFFFGTPAAETEEKGVPKALLLEEHQSMLGRRRRRNGLSLGATTPVSQRRWRASQNPGRKKEEGGAYLTLSVSSCTPLKRG